MPLASIRRRLTTSKSHRRSTSGESVKTDASASSSNESFPTLPSMGSTRHLSYIPHSRAYPQPQPISTPMMPSRSNSPPLPTRSLTLSRGSVPARPPRFTKPRAAPRPPSVMPATASVSMASSSSASSVEAHAPPSRAPNASPPPPVPPRAMPPWRADLINLAESYGAVDAATGDGTSHTFLMTRLHDPNLSERQALLALRLYVDGVHASHRRPSASNYASDVSDDESDFGVAL